ncbi:hypothetical protein CVT26_009664 [Gymnopilus dilepis]|uniref:Secreted protein n=1 Tax=Gymnopilus dilepis TaxID=231916 RepID=A0A409VKQ8_9AGAR|nr:hypothetical protein CVT26_009664 [Gymnopilus dilepis]
MLLELLLGGLYLVLLCTSLQVSHCHISREYSQTPGTDKLIASTLVSAERKPISGTSHGTYIPNHARGEHIER